MEGRRVVNNQPGEAIALDERRRGVLESSWLAVSALGAAVFCLVTSLLFPVSLLTSISATLDVTAGAAGLMVVVPSVAAGAAGFGIALWTSRVSPKVVVAALVGLAGIANLACAVAQDFPTLLAIRVLVGLSLGGVMASVGQLATRLVPADRQATALTVVFGGAAAGPVLGMPAAVLLEALGGWRFAFVVLGGLTIAAAAAVLLTVPPQPRRPAATFSDVLRLAWTELDVRVGLIVTLLLVVGHWAAFTYVRPILGVDGTKLGTLLMAYGIAGVVGNVIAGAAARRAVRRTLVVTAAALAASLALVAGNGLIGGVAPMLLWGLAYGAVPVTLQVWIIRAVPHAADAASALSIAIFNLSVAGGALLGGLIVNGAGARTAAWLGIALAVLAALAVVRHDKKGNT
jgi:predicted MFS family arabinose efflux permease